MNWESHEPFEADVRARLDESRANMAALLELSEVQPGRDVLAAFDAVQQPLNAVGGLVSLFSSVHPNKEVRDCAEQMEQELVAYQTELALHTGLFARIQRVDTGQLDDEEDRRFVEHTLRDFRRSGVDRDEATRAKIRALQEQLVAIGQTFDRNIVEGDRTLRVADGHAGLAGLPQDFLDSHPEDEDGSVTLTTSPTDYLPFRVYADRADLRRDFFLASQRRAYPENVDVLRRLLETRHELATVLGYANWAEYVTEDKMVQNPRAAREFIERASELGLARARAELDELLQEKRKLDPTADTVWRYDHQYFEERVKRSRYAFDSQDVRPYFAFERVRDGILATSAALYGIEFVRNTSEPVWHASVDCYDLIEDGRVIARFFLDMFPRDGKNKHAFVCELSNRVEGRDIPQAALVCNFPEPTSDRPALLLHTQVTTFFHEFGHLLHHLFASRSRYLRFGGISTEWDFVEVPSQMYEEWAWDTGVLQQFALHHETDEPIPADLVRRMRAADEYGKGLHVGVQMWCAMVSLELYDRDPRGLDVARLVHELHERMVPLAHVDGAHFETAFGHLHGYSAIYYTYMWSLVIAKDLYAQFQADPMDREAASRYRAAVLAPGGSRDAAQLVRDFLGRDYAFAAWTSWLKG